MKVGIIPNTTKTNILDVVEYIINQLRRNELEYYISETLLASFTTLPENIKNSYFLNHEDLFGECNLVISIGGDGTMLYTAYEARKYNTPIIGINFGKLGFLAELDDKNLAELIKDLKENNYIIEERMALEAHNLAEPEKELFAINDIVIDKGRWPKMIELVMNVDEEYVSTFTADGIIVASPTGSTGYSLSTGGPIISPKAKAIVLSPISPHTLNMRPLVLSDDQKITISVNSQHSTIQVNCDGQRVYYYEPPAHIAIFKSKNPVKLIHTKSSNYFEILRRKLFWGLDVRNNRAKDIK